MSEVQNTATGQAEEKLAGVLVPVFSIRTREDVGIGDNHGLRQFIDFAAEQGIGFVQLLPINEIGPDNSPYNAISSVALEPMTIDCRPGEGLVDLTKESFEELTKKHKLEDFGEGPVNYSAVRALKRELLEAAFSQFKKTTFGVDSERSREFLGFCEAEAAWLDDYCVYRLLMELEQHNPNWETWNSEYRDLEDAKEFIATSIKNDDSKRSAYWMLFFAYVQWIARSQWKSVADYGREKGVKLMGGYSHRDQRGECRRLCQSGHLRPGLVWRGATRSAFQG